MSDGPESVGKPFRVVYVFNLRNEPHQEAGWLFDDKLLVLHAAGAIDTDRWKLTGMFLSKGGRANMVEGKVFVHKLNTVRIDAPGMPVGWSQVRGAMAALDKHNLQLDVPDVDQYPEWDLCFYDFKRLWPSPLATEQRLISPSSVECPGCERHVCVFNMAVRWMVRRRDEGRELEDAEVDCPFCRTFFSVRLRIHASVSRVRSKGGNVP